MVSSRVVILVAALALLNLGCCHNLLEGDTCDLGDGKGGVCQYLQNCEWAKKEIKNRKRPNVCSYDKLDPILCCPEVKANRMCREYGKFVYEKIPVVTLVPRPEQEYVNMSHCGIGQSYLIPGNMAEPQEFPHMALIGYGSADISWLCSGSLISPRFVLTAGHCLKETPHGEPQWVRLGDLNKKLTIDMAQIVDLAIVGKIAHPDYKPPALYNDIALLKLEKDADINGHVRPCCLHTEDTVSAKKVIASGWEHAEWTNSGSDGLMKTTQNLYPTNECVNMVQSIAGSQDRRLPQGIKGENMLCAGDKYGTKDTCAGDSGGPLQYVLDDPYCMYSIIGIKSVSSGCGAANFSAIYTRVSHYVPWIESVVWTDA